MSHRKLPNWTPATDPNGLAIWLDGENRAISSMTKAGGTAPSSGDQLATWISQVGTARSYVPIPSTISSGACNTSYTDYSGVRHNCAQFTGGVMGANVLTGFQSLSGLTMIVAANVNAVNASALNCLACVQCPGGSGGQSLAQLGIDGTLNTCYAGGRRLTADTYQQVNFGITVGSATPLIIAAVWDFANAKLSVYKNGVSFGSTTFQTSGTTIASDPPGINVGAIGVTGTTSEPSNVDIFGKGAWPSALSADKLAGPFHYLRMRMLAGF